MAIATQQTFVVATHSHCLGVDLHDVSLRVNHGADRLSSAGQTLEDFRTVLSRGTGNKNHLFGS